MQRETSELDHKSSCASFSPVQSTDETMSTCSAETVCESIGQLSVQSTDDIVSEILSDLLTEVCSKDEQWDIATRSTLAPLASSPPLNSTATVDVCGIVRQQMSGQVLCGYCDWRAGWEVLQLRCVEQRAAGEPLLVWTQSCTDLCPDCRLLRSLRSLPHHHLPGAGPVWGPGAGGGSAAANHISGRFLEEVLFAVALSQCRAPLPLLPVQVLGVHRHSAAEGEGPSGLPVVALD